MARILAAFLLLFFFCFIYLGAQNENKEVKDDIEFKSMINKVNNNIKSSNEEQIKQVEKADKIVTKAADKITSLKSEVNQLKNQLNETKAKLDSASSIDDSKPFSIKCAGS